MISLFHTHLSIVCAIFYTVIGLKECLLPNYCEECHRAFAAAFFGLLIPVLCRRCYTLAEVTCKLAQQLDMQRSSEGERMVTDAKHMVLLQNRPSLFSRSDYDLWILDRLMKPFAAGDLDDDEMFVVEVSEQEDSITPSHAAQQQQRQPDQLFRMTPDTHIVSFAPKYRVAFVVDKSPSLSVVDDSSGKAKALGSVAFETLCKCLDGLCRPFSVPSSLAHGPLYVAG
ncbi:hypothetical protein BDZ88DRAFT_311342 [Geranomyces variabilis]|nr:hypothetical protein BDZ88DRAFT_311342 [Geranomyces variabilis]